MQQRLLLEISLPLVELLEVHWFPEKACCYHSLCLRTFTDMLPQMVISILRDHCDRKWTLNYSLQHLASRNIFNELYFEHRSSQTGRWWHFGQFRQSTRWYWQVFSPWDEFTPSYMTRPLPIYLLNLRAELTGQQLFGIISPKMENLPVCCNIQHVKIIIAILYKYYLQACK